MRPAQTTMEAHIHAPVADPDREPVLLSGSARASRLATAGYVLISLGHLGLLNLLAETTTKGAFFASLAVVEVALAFEAAVYALGALGRSHLFSVLTMLGRVRLLAAAMAWPWLLPWMAELCCRSGAVSLSRGVAMLQHVTAVAFFIAGFFLLREVSFLFRGEPASALGGSAPAQLGDCLPGQAVLGGQFRLDKADLEETGRAVFVPARPRQGLYVGAGLALLCHLFGGFVLGANTPRPPWLLLGAIGGLVGRQFGQLPKFKGREEGAPTDSRLLWRREGPRLTCRAGELFWIACCVLELQRAEASPGWLAACH